MTTPPTSRYFAPLPASSITRMYEVRSDGVSIAFPKDSSRWAPASLTVDEALKKPHLYIETDINGTPIKEVNRNNINNELGLNLFGRLESAITAAEQRNWPVVRNILNAVLEFLPSEPKTYRYFVPTNSLKFVRAWRVDRDTNRVEVQMSERPGTWQRAHCTLDVLTERGKHTIEVDSDPTTGEDNA